MKLRLFRNIRSPHLLLALIGAACIAATPAQAAGPAVGIVPYQEAGRVDKVDLAQNQIVIGDRAYVLASNLRVVAGDKPASKTALKNGMNLGFNSTSDRHRSVISEIWILPTR